MLDPAIHSEPMPYAPEPEPVQYRAAEIMQNLHMSDWLQPSHTMLSWLSAFSPRRLECDCDDDVILGEAPIARWDTCV
jgi:hypothetical protein